ncbi:MAG: sigma-70 family RNA polymerase sigma factor [Vicinamibacterales bacterium]|nr:sigma-70 family RNA polymerase sigma factor [Vicinamibacterales bacterium]
MRDLTYSDVERLEAAPAVAGEAFHMDEDAFRAFYDRTARSVWVYLARATGDRQAADDLLQEVYYRFLRAGAACESEDHRRRYVFRVATNLVRDRHRRRVDEVSLPEEGDEGPRAHAIADAPPGRASEQQVQRIDLERALARLKHRERDLLWLAYGEGASHAEIAGALGLKAASVKLLLFRARRRLASLLRRSPGAARREGVR